MCAHGPVIFHRAVFIFSEDDRRAVARYTGPDMSSAGPTAVPAHGRAGTFASGRPRALRWLWAGAVVVPLAVLALGGVVSWNSVVRYETENTVRTVSVLQEQIRRTLEVQNAILRAIDVYIQPMSWQEIADSAQLRVFLKRLSTATSVVMSTDVIDPEGNIVASTENIAPEDRDEILTRGYDRAFPAGTTATEAYVSAPEVDRPGGRLHMHLARPRHAADGRADGGVLLTGFEPARIESFFAAIAQSPGARLVLARADGSVLARYPVPVRARGERLAADDPMFRLARTLPATGPPSVIRTGSPFGGFSLLAVQKVAGYPLFIACAADPALVRAAWLRQMAPLAAAVAAATVLLLLLLAQLQRRISAEHDLLLRRAAEAEAERAAAERQTALEARLRQTEKVAALGHLAAGVAHDFNNVLQSIVISADDLAVRKLPPQEVRELGALILRVAGRGEMLVRRMLDFAHRRDRAEGTTDLSASLRNLGELLARSLGSRHRLRLSCEAAKDVRIRGDADEFEAVVINLVANARDAMPDGGEVAITVAAPEQEDSGGSLVAISVRDAGCGMDQATLERAGEAFFTTKPAGKGTGLGLSMARGFASRHGGRLELASAPGEGTVVTLRLAVAPTEGGAEPRGGGATAIAFAAPLPRGARRWP